MADKIKIKEKNDVKIKKVDKAVIHSKKLKNNIVSVKEKINERTTEKEEESNTTQYEVNKIEKNIFSGTKIGIEKVGHYGKNTIKKVPDNIETTKLAMANLKQQYANSKKMKNKIEIGNVIQDEIIENKIETDNNIKSEQKILKEKISVLNQGKIRKDNAMKNNIKQGLRLEQKSMYNVKIKGRNQFEKPDNTINNVSKSGIKYAKKSYQIEKITNTKEKIKNGKKMIREFLASVRAIITSTEAVISLLIAGLSACVIIVIIIIMIGLICSSPMGIFFSSEKGVGSKTMNAAISDINIEFIDKITEIQNNTPHDEFSINSNKAEWKDIISIYAVTVTNGADQSDVVTLDEKKLKKLKEIFWDMNKITSRMQNEIREIEITDAKGKVKTQKVIRKVLYIDITHRTLQEMIRRYNFSAKQLEQLAELQKEKYNGLWANVLYGSSSGSTDIVRVALEQVGNVGGQPYWSWYGFNGRVEWCACFVSWCANQCGYIEQGIIPKFASCQNEGIAWFKTCSLWQERGYIPKPGDIIFFDWEGDGHSDHVGIVERCENGNVYTIEGNSNNDTCRQKEYDVSSSVICGYGTPLY